MKATEPANSFTININKKKYMFKCPDGEEHVRAIEDKLTSTIATVSGEEPGHIMSDYAVKVALLLADDAICERKNRNRQVHEIEEKVAPMLEELDRVLGNDGQF